MPLFFQRHEPVHVAPGLSQLTIDLREAPQSLGLAGLDALWDEAKRLESDPDAVK